jgi:pimeloyl-ACP methyl ester carboxylesterase
MSRAGRPAILLLHGQPGGARDWNRVIAELPDQVNAIAVDRPGWDGQSRPQDLAGNARAALAFLDAREIERATIVGHSLGGAVAAWLAAEAPDRVSALVLAAPAANRASLEWFDRWLTFPVAGPLTTAASLTGLGLALSLAPVRGWLARETQLDAAYLRAAGRSLLTGWARHAFTVEQQTLVHDVPRLEDRLSAIRAPTWVVTGSADRVVPASAPRALARQIPGAHLVVLDGAGHLLPQRHARRLSATILSATGVECRRSSPAVSDGPTTSRVS